MTAHALRTWFLCTLLVVGLLPMPAAAAGEQCCEPGSVSATAPPAGPSCCDASADACELAAAAAAADAHEGTCEKGCEDCHDCDGTCACVRCGCHPAGPAPAMRPRAISFAFVGPAAPVRAEAATCVPRDETYGLLRPPRR